jgi:hypothetical protein
MNQYTISEFSQKIRAKYPGSYDDLSDKKLIELWLKKFPNDIHKLNDNQSTFQEENISREITNYIFKWIGIVVCVLSALSIFVTTEWIVSIILESEMEFGQDDSDASAFLKNIGYIMAKIGLWLKKLPIYAKISGIVIGGIIWFSNTED